MSSKRSLSSDRNSHGDGHRRRQDPARRRRRRVPVFIAAGALSVVTATGAAAATGSLPEPVQRVAAEVLSKVGISVPDGSSPARELPTPRRPADAQISIPADAHDPRTVGRSRINCGRRHRRGARHGRRDPGVTTAPSDISTGAATRSGWFRGRAPLVPLADPPVAAGSPTVDPVISPSEPVPAPSNPSPPSTPVPHRATKPHRRWKTRTDWHRTARVDPPTTTTRVDYHGQPGRTTTGRPPGPPPDVQRGPPPQVDPGSTAGCTFRSPNGQARTASGRANRTARHDGPQRYLGPRRVSRTDSSRLRRRVWRRAHHDGVVSRHGRDRCRVASRRRGLA